MKRKNSYWKFNLSVTSSLKPSLPPFFFEASMNFRLEIPQPFKNQGSLNPESAIYRTPTSVSASEVSKYRPASKYQVSKYRPCCIYYGFLQVRFVGNVAVGSDDLRVSELRKCYNAVVLAYGAAKDRQLDIPGESLANVLPARTFVGLYNGWLKLSIVKRQFPSTVLKKMFLANIFCFNQGILKEPTFPVFILNLGVIFNFVGQGKGKIKIDL